jgi:hypothetical protein
MGTRVPEVERVIFIGKCGTDELSFACMRGGSYGILRNNALIRSWPAEEAEMAVSVFLHAVDRRTTPNERAELAQPASACA